MLKQRLNIKKKKKEVMEIIKTEQKDKMLHKKRSVKNVNLRTIIHHGQINTKRCPEILKKWKYPNSMTRRRISKCFTNLRKTKTLAENKSSMSGK